VDPLRSPHTSALDGEMFSASNPRCPHCSGRIDTKPFSLGAQFGTMVIGDFAIYAVAGIFLLVGLVWEPAWAISLIVVIAFIVVRSTKRAHYVCVECKREFTYKQLYAVKP
jgi:DNA-directed RNA polymerase subunit RPC12/RpoP